MTSLIRGGHQRCGVPEVRRSMRRRHLFIAGPRYRGSSAERGAVGAARHPYPALVSRCALTSFLTRFALAIREKPFKFSAWINHN
jgi:hypothetical protein